MSWIIGSKVRRNKNIIKNENEGGKKSQGTLEHQSRLIRSFFFIFAFFPTYIYLELYANGENDYLITSSPDTCIFKNTYLFSKFENFFLKSKLQNKIIWAPKLFFEQMAVFYSLEGALAMTAFVDGDNILSGGDSIS